MYCLYYGGVRLSWRSSQTFDASFLSRRYPQPPLADRVSLGKASTIPGGEGLELGTLGLHHVEKAGRQGQRNSFRRVHCVPNPCTLKINEVVIGVTSTDAVFHISTNETSGHLELGSRLNRICQHMLQQQSYYPMFPASLHKANLNLKEMERWSMPCQPDVLIVPSALTTFAHKVLDHTVAVNPGRLTQGRLAGTYAVVDIHPMSREQLEQAGRGGDNSVEILHDVPNRTRIEIKRI
jgi:DNA polymerase alpha subunit B